MYFYRAKLRQNNVRRTFSDSVISEISRCDDNSNCQAFLSMVENQRTLVFWWLRAKAQSVRRWFKIPFSKEIIKVVQYQYSGLILKGWALWIADIKICCCSLPPRSQKNQFGSVLNEMSAYQEQIRQANKLAYIRSIGKVYHSLPFCFFQC